MEPSFDVVISQRQWAWDGLSLPAPLLEHWVNIGFYVFVCSSVVGPSVCGASPSPLCLHLLRLFLSNPCSRKQSEIFKKAILIIACLSLNFFQAHCYCYGKCPLSMLLLLFVWSGMDGPWISICLSPIDAPTCNQVYLIAVAFVAPSSQLQLPSTQAHTHTHARVHARVHRYRQTNIHIHFLYLCSFLGSVLGWFLVEASFGVICLEAAPFSIPKLEDEMS